MIPTALYYWLTNLDRSWRILHREKQNWSFWTWQTFWNYWFNHTFLQALYCICIIFKTWYDHIKLISIWPLKRGFKNDLKTNCFCNLYIVIYFTPCGTSAPRSSVTCYLAQPSHAGGSPDSFDLAGHTDSKPGQQTHLCALSCAEKSECLSAVWPVLNPFNMLFSPMWAALSASNLCCDWLFPGNPPSKPNKKTIKQRFLKLLPCYRSGSSVSSCQSKCQDTKVHHQSHSPSYYLVTENTFTHQPLGFSLPLFFYFHHIPLFLWTRRFMYAVWMSEGVTRTFLSLHPFMQEVHLMMLNWRQHVTDRRGSTASLSRPASARKSCRSSTGASKTSVKDTSEFSVHAECGMECLNNKDL